MKRDRNSLWVSLDSPGPLLLQEIILANNHPVLELMVDLLIHVDAFTRIPHQLEVLDRDHNLLRNFPRKSPSSNKTASASQL